MQGDGTVEWAGGKLQMKALTTADWLEFQAGLLAMANSKETTSGAFASYVEWLERNPAQIFLDGANIALFGQSFAGTGPGNRPAFSWRQVELVLDAVEQKFPTKRVAVVLHTGRMNAAPSRKPDAQAIIQRLEVCFQLQLNFLIPKICPCSIEMNDFKVSSFDMKVKNTTPDENIDSNRRLSVGDCTFSELALNVF